MLNIYTCDSFKGHYPVGAAAVVVAGSAEQAAELLNDELRKNHFLKGDAEPYMMKIVDRGTPHAVVLVDGVY